MFSGSKDLDDKLELQIPSKRKPFLRTQRRSTTEGKWGALMRCDEVELQSLYMN